jgi:3D (Asp-Asp-Asp) domain-containing protein
MQIVAVSPDLVEAGLVRGAELRIEGLPGVWTVLDRTASRHRNRIDIYMGTDVEAAIKWGLKKVTIRWSTPASRNSRP